MKFGAINIWLVDLARVAFKIVGFVWKVALYIQHLLTCGPAHESFDEGIPTFEHVALPSELEFHL